MSGLIQDSFVTLGYKQGYIFVNCWHSIITGKSGETISYCPKDGAGSFPCKSLHAAKILITKWGK